MSVLKRGASIDVEYFLIFTNDSVYTNAEWAENKFKFNKTITMKKTSAFLAVIVTIILSSSVFAQDNHNAVWNHKGCAVCLTYDDGLDIDLDNVVPILDSLGFKGTFFLPGNSESLRKRLNEWRAIAAKGHELGNHSMFHACEGNLPGREWVKPDYDLSKYSVQRIIDEVLITNTLLYAIDGKVKRTYAYPCGDTIVGGVDYMDKMKDVFVAARGVKFQLHKINDINLYNVDCFGVNGQSGEELIDLVKKAEETNSLLVFLFHGVGGGHNINVSLEAHRQLLVYLKQHEKDIWVAPFIDVMEYVKSYNKEK
jgi:sialate O-acetylesterase